LTAGHCLEVLFPDGARPMVSAEGCPIDRYRNPVPPRPGPGVWVSFDNDPTLLEPQETQYECETCLQIERVLIHPEYDKKIDVGVIILKEPLDDALIPIKLPTLGLLDTLKRSNTLKKAEFLAVGYGATAIDPPTLHTGGGERKVCLLFRRLPMQPLCLCRE
jgi:hypothetical protein